MVLRCCLEGSVAFGLLLIRDGEKINWEGAQMLTRKTPETNLCSGDRSSHLPRARSEVGTYRGTCHKQSALQGCWEEVVTMMMQKLEGLPVVPSKTLCRITMLVNVVIDVSETCDQMALLYENRAGH
jgi:hypothetical protein